VDRSKPSNIDSTRIWSIYSKDKIRDSRFNQSKRIKKTIEAYNFLVENVLLIYGEYDDEGRHDLYLSISHPGLLSTPQDMAEDEDKKTMEIMFNTRKSGRRLMMESQKNKSPRNVNANNESSEITTLKERVKILRAELSLFRQIQEQTLLFMENEGLSDHYKSYMMELFPDYFSGVVVGNIEFEEKQIPMKSESKKVTSTKESSSKKRTINKRTHDASREKKEVNHAQHCYCLKIIS